MKVTVLGKEQVSGVSRKTGKEYCSNVAHVQHKKNGVEGFAVSSVWLDAKTYPLNSIQVGKEYNAEYDNRGFLTDFTRV